MASIRVLGQVRRASGLRRRLRHLVRSVQRKVTIRRLSAEKQLPTDVVLAFAGDVHFAKKTRRLLDNPETVFGSFTPVLRAADLTMINLETAVTERGEPADKRFCFRAPATAYTALRAGGVDVVSLANNHTLDYGHVGLADTVNAAATAGVAYVGAGRNASEAYAPYETVVRGVRIAVFGFSQIRKLAEDWRATDTRPGVAMAYDTARAGAAVRRVRPNADVVVVYMHWGREGDQRPKREMRTFAACMADAGADIVVGTHAHLPLGDGWINDTYVHWGLGNFVWYGASHSTDTGVLRLTVRAGKVAIVEWLAGVVTGTGQPSLVNGSELAAQRRRLAQVARYSRLPNQPAHGAAIMRR